MGRAMPTDDQPKFDAGLDVTTGVSEVSLTLALEEISQARLAKDLDLAERLIRQLAERDPDDAGLQLRAFNLFHRIGRWGAMLGLAESAAALNAIDRSPSAMVLMAEALAKSGRAAESAALLARTPMARVTGVAAKRLPAIEALVGKLLRRAGPAAVQKPASVVSGARHQAIAHRSAPLELDAGQRAALLADAEAAMEKVKELRLERRTAAAAELLVLIIDRYGDNEAVLSQALNSLYRNGSYQQILTVLGAPRFARAVRQPELAVLKADCLVRVGKSGRAEARMIILGIKANEIKGQARAMWSKLRQDLVRRSMDPTVAAIEEAFEGGRTLKGATLFRALLDECRQYVAVAPGGQSVVATLADHAGEQTDAALVPGDLREAESSRYLVDFAAATGDAPTDQRKVLIVSDSIALPRESTGVGLEESYPYRLHQALTANSGGRLGVAPDCRRGRTVIDALLALESQSGAFDAVVIQVGIVDCAPRVFGASDVRAVRAARGDDAAEAMVAIAGTYRQALVGDRYNSVYVKIDRFEAGMRDAVRVASRLAPLVIVCGVVTPSKRGGKLANVPLTLNIADYNEAMKRVAEQEGAIFADADEYIWSRDDPTTCFTQDNYHYNAEGHRHCAEFLTGLIIEGGGEAQARTLNSGN